MRLARCRRNAPVRPREGAGRGGIGETGKIIQIAGGGDINVTLSSAKKSQAESDKSLGIIGRIPASDVRSQDVADFDGLADAR